MIVYIPLNYLFFWILNSKSANLLINFRQNVNNLPKLVKLTNNLPFDMIFAYGIGLIQVLAMVIIESVLFKNREKTHKETV